MGPCATSDLAGHRRRLADPQGAAQAPARASATAAPSADRLAEMGRFGQKTSAGFYKYEPGQPHAASRTRRSRRSSQAVSKELGIERRAIGDDEILERCLYAMINEGAKILEEGIALRASDIDTVWINGYGFPPHRGGPMFYADTVGLSKIYATVQEFAAKLGKVWKPSALLEKLAKADQTFASLDSGKA